MGRMLRASYQGAARRLGEVIEHSGQGAGCVAIGPRPGAIYQTAYGAWASWVAK
jgi:hypothetical protein